ncbi:MAG: diguanylate cyclase [Terriglobia bacterium]|jgi:diguanylate cyclase (GGDEF)-like protein|nr:diguanylate cyclase [Terriglobia bacterium]
MKILVADDSRIYQSMLKTLLESWGYEVVLTTDGNQARDVLLQQNAPRLALLDCIMPGLSGLELCELIRQKNQAYIYTILLSANEEQEQIVKGFELGADDYLLKPFQDFELRARLKVGERIVRTQEELIEARESLKFEATHDSMLRVWNRRAIVDLLLNELSRSRRFHTPLSIFLADIDFFKNVNDTYGHLAGDEVLRDVVKRMAETIRRYDNIGRYGGEEFLVVLPDCNETQAFEVAERVRVRVSDTPVLAGAQEIRVTASFGVSQWREGDGPEVLLHNADVALYRAKAAGRNRIETETAAAGV